jgi:hypothetical protein
MSFMSPPKPKPVVTPPPPPDRQSPEDPTLQNASSLIGTGSDGIVSADPAQILKRKANVVKTSLLGGARAA